MLLNVESYAQAWDGTAANAPSGGWAAGDFAYLTADTSSSNNGIGDFAKGSIIQYDGTSWSLYERKMVG